MNEAEAKKPEKKKVYSPTDKQVGDGAYYDLREIKGYNQACDDWEKFLPNKDEIERIVNDYCRGVIATNKVMLVYGNLIEAISKRIRGEP